MSLEDFIEAAAGRKKVDLLLKNANLFNVLSGEIIKESVAVYGDKICGFGNYAARQIIDLKGAFLLPGYIDAHIHLESSMVTVSEFAKTVVPLGTTTVIIDPHEIANVLGLAGIKYILDSSKYQPLDVFLMMPSCVPATSLETSGAVITAGDIFPYLSEKWVVGLGEVMNFQDVVQCSKEVLDKIKIIAPKKIDGHAPGLSGKNLSAYISAGIKSDHESISYKEAQEKLRKGMHIMIREGTVTKNLLSLIGLVNEKNSVNFSFVSDDRSPSDLIKEGHINYLVKTAISDGMDPLLAVKLATINTARYFALYRHGAIAPGYYANMQVLSSFNSQKPLMVFKGGKLVAEKGKLLKLTEKPKDIYIRGSINVKWLEEKDFKIKVIGNTVRTIGIVPSQIITEYKKFETPRKRGSLISDTTRDLLKICVVERHRSSGNIGIGMLNGMGLKEGAIATSISHDSHNIVAVGVRDSDIMAACIEVIKMGGGIAVVNKGELLGKLALPIAGLISELSIKNVDRKLRSLIKSAHSLGAIPENPFFTMSFLCLPVIPALKITDKGLVDVNKFKLVGLFE